MNLLFINQLIASDVPEIMIAVFIHSLWQGIAVCLFAWLSLQATKKWSSNSRYNILILFLFAFAVCILFTFYSQPGNQTLSNDRSGERPVISSSGTLETIPIVQSILQWCYNHSSSIFFIWCIIFLFKANQMIRDVITVDRLRRSGTVEINNDWKMKFDELKCALQIRKNVFFKESWLISQPMVIGVLKPMVLIPLGFLNSLQPKEIEAILLHELAHIRRNDYLVNFLQTILETVFFFNPFVYWLSSMIRNEREHCCDAMTIKHTQSKKVFLQALLSVQQHTTKNRLAMGLMGKKNLLVARVDRIIGDKDKSVSPAEKIIMAVGYLLLFIALVSFSFISKNNPPQPEEVKYNSKKRTPNSVDAKLQTDSKWVGQTTLKKIDTIPENASKDFITGYNAALNYRKHKFVPKDKKRKRIEANIIKNRPAQIIEPDQALTSPVLDNQTKNKKETSEAVVALIFPEPENRNKTATSEKVDAIIFIDPEINDTKKRKIADHERISTILSDLTKNKRTKEAGHAITSVSQPEKINKKKIKEALVAEKIDNQ